MRPDPADGRGLSVLIVDDHPDGAESLAYLVQLWGHDVAVAPTGPAALAATAASPPDVVLLEPRLRGRDGWEVARRLGAAGRRPLVIAVTTGGTDADRSRSVEAGVLLHLVKPVEPDVLAGFLERAGRVIARPCVAWTSAVSGA